ncbi:MAG: prepilin peptidase [Candidatus Veblenbacteria bacterium]|nr:prepilin peptidase [Candidatus Veblenbacteria bacterium]
MWLLLSALLGLAVGSFLNVLVVRLAASETLGGRSRCRNCGTQLKWYHNIPLLSFVVLRGKCVFCRRVISWQYPAVEAAAGSLFVLGAWVLPAGDWLALITFLVLATYAVTLFVFDFRFKLLPDVLTLSGAAALVLLNLVRGFSPFSLLAGVVVAAGLFGVQYLLSRGRWIGSGDIRLGALMGAALGWPHVVVALALAYWAGALAGIALMLFKRYGLKSELPFGTFLTASTVVTFLWGSELIDWYLRFVGV